jgi:hypothetical protein
MDILGACPRNHLFDVAFGFYASVSDGNFLSEIFKLTLGTH